jgi:hypothetical protein
MSIDHVARDVAARLAEHVEVPGRDVQTILVSCKLLEAATCSLLLNPIDSVDHILNK